MAYIGNTVQNQGFAPAIDYFNGDGVTVTFTLSRPVASVAQLTAVIENVVQNPSTAFTVAGSAITFTSAPPSGTNNIWVEYTSLVTTYAAISQDPTVIGDLTATGGYSATGDYGNSFVDGVIMDYVTGNARITTGASDGITLYNGGTSSRSALMAITSAGNVGIGVTPSAWNSALKAIEIGSVGTSVISTPASGNLTLAANAYYNASASWIYGQSQYAARYAIRSVDGQHQWFTAPSGTAGNTITFTQAMTLDASGNLGIGTSSPNQNGTGVTCHINSSTAGTWATTHYTNGSTGSAASDGLLVGTLGADGAYVFNYENTPMIFATNSVERMRLAASGELSINTTSVYVSSKISILGAGGGAWGITVVNPSSATTAMPVFVSLNAAGSVVGYINSDNTSTAYITSSDYRLKENIAPMTGALEKVALLKPCTYTWKSDGSSGEGFIAHELQDVCPSAVSGEKDAVFEDGSIKPQGIDTSFLVATLTAAIQEQQAIITDLKARIETLENK